MEVYTDFPERLKTGTTVFLGAKHKPANLRRTRQHNEGLLMSFDGVDTPESAGLLRNQLVYVKTADRPALAKGQYYHHQLLGITVFDDAGIPLGKLTEIIETGANDVFVVTSDNNQELLLPAIKDVILDVNVEEKAMRVHLLPGLDGQED